MTEFLGLLKDFALGFLRLLESLLSKVSPDASAIILFVIAVGILLLLAMLAWILGPERLKKTELEGVDDITLLKKTIRQLEDRLERSENDPKFSTLEKIYFGLNGITNSGLLLSIGLLLWEFSNLRGRKVPIPATAAADELGRLMGVLAFTLLVSTIVVRLAHIDHGRSYQRINRAFFVSLVIGAAAFLVFYAAVPHSL